ARAHAPRRPAGRTGRTRRARRASFAPGPGGLAVAPNLRLPALQAVGAAGGDILAKLAAHRAHIRGELPDLVFAQVTTKGRHAIGSTLHDGREDLRRLAAVTPLVVGERRAHAAAALRMAAVAVVPAVEALALCDAEGVLV